MTFKISQKQFFVTDPETGKRHGFRICYDEHHYPMIRFTKDSAATEKELPLSRDATGYKHGSDVFKLACEKAWAYLPILVDDNQMWSHLKNTSKDLCQMKKERDELQEQLSSTKEKLSSWETQQGWQDQECRVCKTAIVEYPSICEECYCEIVEYPSICEECYCEIVEYPSICEECYCELDYDNQGCIDELENKIAALEEQQEAQCPTTVYVVVGDDGRVVSAHATKESAHNTLSYMDKPSEAKIVQLWVEGSTAVPSTVWVLERACGGGAKVFLSHQEAQAKLAKQAVPSDWVVLQQQVEGKNHPCKNCVDLKALMRTSDVWKDRAETAEQKLATQQADFGDLQYRLRHLDERDCCDHCDEWRGRALDAEKRLKETEELLGAYQDNDTMGATEDEYRVMEARALDAETKLHQAEQGAHIAHVQMRTAQQQWKEEATLRPDYAAGYGDLTPLEIARCAMEEAPTHAEAGHGKPLPELADNLLVGVHALLDWAEKTDADVDKIANLLSRLSEQTSNNVNRLDKLEK